MKVFIVTHYYVGNTLKSFLFEAYQNGYLMYRGPFDTVTKLAEYRRAHKEQGYVGLRSVDVFE